VQVEHDKLKSYHFASDRDADRLEWVDALTEAATLQNDADYPGFVQPRYLTICNYLCQWLILVLLPAVIIRLSMSADDRSVTCCNYLCWLMLLEIC